MRQVWEHSGDTQQGDTGHTLIPFPAALWRGGLVGDGT
jgi:hypothetical protein